MKHLTEMHIDATRVNILVPLPDTPLLVEMENAGRMTAVLRLKMRMTRPARIIGRKPAKAYSHEMHEEHESIVALRNPRASI